MKARIRATQQIVDVRCIDTQGDISAWTYQNVKDEDETYLGCELDFLDLRDYKSWTEELIHDLAVAEFRRGHVEEADRKRVVADIVLFAFALVDRMQQENKTWR